MCKAGIIGAPPPLERCQAPPAFNMQGKIGEPQTPHQFGATTDLTEHVVFDERWHATEVSSLRQQAKALR
jgi:hypothetical protein